jgi:hypothetical protein
MASTNDGMKIESPADLAQDGNADVALWNREIKAAQKFMDKFHKSAKKINDRYLDKRDATNNEFKVNLFWSTVQVVMSMLYAQPPKADVKRLYDDFNDEPSRVGSEILERLLNNDVQADNSSTNASMRYAIQDWVVLGMGQVWSRYDVQTAQMEFEGQMYEQIGSESAPVEYVHWQDFLYSPARIWEEVRWVARRSYLTKEKLIERFGEEVAARVQMTGKGSAGGEGKSSEVKIPQDPWQKAEVWEIWDRRTKKVFWYSDGCDTLLDERDDPLGLEDFFPCPAPLIANASTTELVPRSDYVMAQDQFEQLDEINTRITWLTRAMKVVGVYDRSAEGVQRMLSQAVENQLIPVDNWAMFAESGGLKAKVEWLPVAEVAAVIERLLGLREQVKGQIYEVLGISDIMRGNTKASETLGAQQIKAQFGSTRVQLKQFYVGQFVQQAMNVKAQIISRHFQPQTIAEQSNVMMTPDAEFAMPAIELIKNPDLAKYRVKVQADSLAYIDRKEENEVRTAALTAIGQFIQQVMGLTERLPGAAPYMLEIVRWYGAGFKGFQEIEGIMDKAIEAANKAAMQPPPPDPLHEAEVAEKMAGVVERKAAAVQKLADAELKTVQSMGTFPAPPEMFVGGMPGMGQGAPMQSAPMGLGEQMGAAPGASGMAPSPGGMVPPNPAMAPVPQTGGLPPPIPPQMPRGMP